MIVYRGEIANDCQTYLISRPIMTVIGTVRITYVEKSLLDTRHVVLRHTDYHAEHGVSRWNRCLSELESVGRCFTGQAGDVDSAPFL